MRITGLGHAGLFIETRAGSVLCDPWVNPAFFGSWFPFPDNRGLDWDHIGACDYLYISHRHQDHFDTRLLADRVRKDATVLLPDYPTGELERELRAVGFKRFWRMPAGEPVTRHGLRLMVTPCRAPSDGPVGDSALSVDDGTAIVLNQNDSHPIDMPKLLEFGPVDGYFTQFSGAIWWPMVYDLPDRAKVEFARLKRTGQTTRALHYIDQVNAAHVFPTAGPPCFLDDDLFEFNGRGTHDTSIFTDQAEFLTELAEHRPHVAGHKLLPGTRVELTDGECKVWNELFSDAEIDTVFHHKWDYLRRQQVQRADEVAAWRSQPSAIPDNLFAQIRDWWEPLIQRSEFIAGGIGASVRFTADDLDLLLDFEHGQVRRYAGERVRYTFRTHLDLVAANVACGEVDWSNSLFLSMRFSASRIGKFNEYLYTFFKCLSFERLDYVERWYAARRDSPEEIGIGDWIVQRRCPHLGADLSQTATVTDGTLTCSQHGWRFDLESGRCLSSAGHPIRSRRRAAGEEAATEAGSGMAEVVSSGAGKG